MRVGKVRPKREDLFVARNRFIQPILISQDVREVVMRLEQVGLDHERLPVASNCLVRLALDIEHIAEVDVCRGKVGRMKRFLATKRSSRFGRTFPTRITAWVTFSETRAA